MMGVQPIVRPVFYLLILAGVLLGSDPRAQFERLKSEGKAAIASEKWAVAQARYEKLIQLAPTVKPGIYEMYAEVVSPLAEIYKKTEALDKLEDLYQARLEKSGQGLDRGLALADLGFFYQNSDFASADKFRGERLVDDAMASFDRCSHDKTEGDQCRRRMADTAGIQGAVYFQRLQYDKAEPLFRRVVTLPDTVVQDEVMLVSLHALRGILILRKDYDGAKQLELRAAAFEAAHPAAVNRLRDDHGTRSRTQ
jgi:tetratricopeptide (TPR) repeat protein